MFLLPARAIAVRGSGSVDAASAAFFAALAVAPDARRRGAVDALVRGLKAAGLWAKIDDIRIPVPGCADGFLVDLRGRRPKATPIGSPAYDAATGAYAGDGVGAAIDLGYDLTATAGLAFGRDSGSVTLWPLAGAGYMIAGAGLRVSLSALAAKGGCNFANVGYRLNSTTTWDLAGTRALAPYDAITVDRATSSALTLTVGGRVVTTQADTSAAVAAGSVQLLGNTTQRLFGTTKLGAYLLTGSLSVSQRITLRALLATYLVAAGVVATTTSIVPSESPLFALGGDAATLWQAQCAGQPWSVMVDGPRLVFDLRAGDFWAGDLAVGHNDRNRAQIFSPNRFGKAADVWTSMAVRLPSTCDPLAYPQWSLMQQWHQDDSVSSSPPWSLSMSTNQPAYADERWYVATNYDTTSTNPPGWHGAYADLLGVSPIGRDRIYRVVTCLRFATDGTAKSLVWIDGAQVQAATGINLGFGADASAGPYPTLGPYRAVGTNRTVVEVWNFEVGADLSDRILNPLPVVSTVSTTDAAISAALAAALRWEDGTPILLENNTYLLQE